MKPPAIKSPNYVSAQPNDVLSGRGNAAKHHNGNVLFRELVKEARDYYVAFPTNKKNLVSQVVYLTVKSLNPQGRYLKAIEQDNGDLWEELKPWEALAKTSQALREGQPGHKKAIAFCRIPESQTAEKLNELKVSRLLSPVTVAAICMAMAADIDGLFFNNLKGKLECLISTKDRELTNKPLICLSAPRVIFDEKNPSEVRPVSPESPTIDLTDNIPLDKPCFPVTPNISVEIQSESVSNIFALCL